VGALSYQWRRNGAIVAGASGATLAIPAATAAQAGDYTVTVRVSDNGTPVGTATGTVTVRLDRKGPRVVSVTPKATS